MAEASSPRPGDFVRGATSSLLNFSPLTQSEDEESPAQSAGPARIAVVNVPAPTQTATTKQVTDFFAPSALGKRARTTELEVAPGKFLNIDQVQGMRDEEVTVEMLAACVARIRALEDELEKSTSKAASTSGAGPSAAKKARTDAVEQASSQVVTKKQTDMILKRLATGTKQGLKGVKFFTDLDLTTRDVKTSDMLSKAEFDAVFTGGTLTQPTPQNKPGSKVYIKEYTKQQVSELLGSSLGNLKGELWTKGGAPTRGFGFFGGGGGFSKGKKMGSTPLTVTKMKVQYSLTSQQLSVTATLLNEGAYFDMLHDVLNDNRF